MGFRINTNTLSLNAQRNLSKTTKAFAKSLERLSSGSRINRAGDDAAGLAIGTGIETQIRSLLQGVRNLNDAQGFLNTAEGAIQTQTELIQRVRELALQAANGSLGVQERGFLQTEVAELLEEFDRIASETSFNGQKLLDGSFANQSIQVGANKGEVIDLSISSSRSQDVLILQTQLGSGEFELGYS